MSGTVNKCNGVHCVPDSPFWDECHSGYCNPADDKCADPPAPTPPEPTPPEPEPTPDDDGETGGRHWWLIAIIAIALVILAVVLVIAIRAIVKRKKNRKSL